MRSPEAALLQTEPSQFIWEALSSALSPCRPHTSFGVLVQTSTMLHKYSVLSYTQPSLFFTLRRHLAKSLKLGLNLCHHAWFVTVPFLRTVICSSSIHSCIQPTNIFGNWLGWG